MTRIAIELVRARDLDDLPKVHNRDSICDVLHDGEIVRNEKIRESKLCLKIL
jgi:hypothetical protein